MRDSVFTTSGGEFSLWLEPSGSLMMKTLSKNNDPIELGEGELLELIELLTKLYVQLTE